MAEPKNNPTGNGTSMVFYWSANVQSGEDAAPFLENETITNGVKHTLIKGQSYTLEELASAGLTPFKKFEGGAVYRIDGKSSRNYWFKEIPYQK